MINFFKTFRGLTVLMVVIMISAACSSKAPVKETIPPQDLNGLSKPTLPADVSGVSKPSMRN